MFEGPTEYVNARRDVKSKLYGFLHAIENIMFHGHLDYFHKPPLGGFLISYMASNTSCFMVTWTSLIDHLLEVDLTQKPSDHGTPNACNH